MLCANAGSQAVTRGRESVMHTPTLRSTSFALGDPHCFAGRHCFSEDSEPVARRSALAVSQTGRDDANLVVTDLATQVFVNRL